MVGNDMSPGGTPSRSDGGPYGTVVLSPDELPKRAGGSDAGGGPDAPVLVGLAARFGETRFALPAERARIGRDAENDIVLNEPDISLEHARITRSGGQWRLVDLNSTNGTFVNGKRVDHSVIQFGDEIAFGPVGFIFAPGDMSTSAVRALRAGRRRSGWWIAPAVLILGAAVLYLLTG